MSSESPTDPHEPQPEAHEPQPEAGEPQTGAGRASARAGEPPAGASEQELREAYEAELARISSAEMALQAAVSLLNIGGYRLGPPAGTGGPGGPEGGGRDLEQVRDAIDGVRALMPILERRMAADELRPLRDALSQLQMAYARGAAAEQPQGQGAGEAGHESPGGGEQGTAGGGEGPGTPGGQAPRAPKPGEEPGEGKPGGPGPAETSGRLWVPGR
jgi:hypothetical protein